MACNKISYRDWCLAYPNMITKFSSLQQVAVARHNALHPIRLCAADSVLRDWQSVLELDMTTKAADD